MSGFTAILAEDLDFLGHRCDESTPCHRAACASFAFSLLVSFTRPPSPVRTDQRVIANPYSKAAVVNPYSSKASIGKKAHVANPYGAVPGSGKAKSGKTLERERQVREK